MCSSPDSSGLLGDRNAIAVLRLMLYSRSGRLTGVEEHAETEIAETTAAAAEHGMQAWSVSHQRRSVGRSTRHHTIAADSRGVARCTH